MYKYFHIPLAAAVAVAAAAAVIPPPAHAQLNGVREWKEGQPENVREIGFLPFPVDDVMCPGETKALHLYEVLTLTLKPLTCTHKHAYMYSMYILARAIYGLLTAVHETLRYVYVHIMRVVSRVKNSGEVFGLIVIFTVMARRQRAV